MDNNNNNITNEQEQKIIRGYKVFNPDWTCRGFQYEVGKTYSLDLKEGEKLKCCENGFHFCTKLNDCFNYYTFNPYNKFAEVEVFGNIDMDIFNNDTKMCTDKIRIVREISYGEALNMLNEGKYNGNYGNKGHWNKGCYNIGSSNMGDCNIGEANNGSYNKGCWNKGENNIGKFNIGNSNIGVGNTGTYNTGNRNVTSFNKCDYSTGSFCTSSPTYYLFNKPSNWTYEDWIYSRAYDILKYIAPKPTVWITEDEMTNEEKKEYPEHATTKGYLKVRTDEEMRCEWKNNWNYLLGKKDREIIMNIPNFDPNIFEEITGIKVDMSELNDN